MLENEENLDGVVWHKAEEFGLRGIGWQSEARKNRYDRLPASLEEQIGEKLWTNGTHPKGLYVEFSGTPRNVYARWTLNIDAFTSGYASDLACGGLDMYTRLSCNETWRYAGSREPWKLPDCDGRLNIQDGLDAQPRQWRVYLPLAAQVTNLEIGSKEPLAPLAGDDQSPIVYYGTSIVAGSCVSRPAMAHTCQLGRMLNREIINLGFPGMAYLEEAMAHAIARIDTSLYVIDPLPNNSPGELAERLPKFLNIIREVRPETPILLVQDRLFGNAHCHPGKVNEQKVKNVALDETLHRLQGEGMQGLHVARHPDWFGEDGTVDASHPSDLGAYHFTQALLPIIQPLLKPR